MKRYIITISEQLHKALRLSPPLYLALFLFCQMAAASSGANLFSTSPKRDSFITAGGRPRFIALFNYPFTLTASHFLFARAKEKVTKEKARPASGFRCAQLPSLRRCSEGRREGPSLAHHSSFGIHAKRPSPQHLHSTS